MCVSSGNTQGGQGFTRERDARARKQKVIVCSPPSRTRSDRLERFDLVVFSFNRRHVRREESTTYLFLSPSTTTTHPSHNKCVVLYSKVRLIGAGTAETPVSIFQQLAKAGENHSVTRSRTRSRPVHRCDVGRRVLVPCRARERRKRRYSMKMPSLLGILRRMGKVAVGSTGSTVSLDR